MASTITTGATVIAPTAINGYTSTRPAHTVVHPIVGRASADVTLRPAGQRTGTLTCVFTGATGEADSLAAETALAGAAVFSLIGDLGSVEMSFVLPEGGSLNRALSSSGGAWVVSFDWQEVTP